VTILRLRVLEGEGDVLPLGSRTGHPVVVQVTDETGKPVEGATVSFILPPDGPTGTFTGNMRTDIAISGGDGRALMSGVQWNRTPGPVSVRVTAAKQNVRAGTVASLYLSETATVTPPRRIAGGGGSHWKKIALLVGAASAAGLVVGWKKSEASPAGSASAVQEPSAGAVQIGSPSITIGKP
jgi:hypothetical protein